MRRAIYLAITLSLVWLFFHYCLSVCSAVRIGISKKNHKNTVCKLILGVFVLSAGLYVADYFLMEQKLFNSIKNVLPQDNLINLIVGAVLTIVIVYALFQLLKSPPHSAVNDTTSEDLNSMQLNYS